MKVCIRDAMIAGALPVVLSACAMTPPASREEIASVRRALNECLSHWAVSLDDGISPADVIGHQAAQRCVGESNEFTRVLIQGKSEGYAYGATQAAPRARADYATGVVLEHRALGVKNASDKSEA